MRHTDVAALAALLAVPAVYAQDMGEFTVGQAKALLARDGVPVRL